MEIIGNHRLTPQNTHQKIQGEASHFLSSPTRTPPPNAPGSLDHLGSVGGASRCTQRNISSLRATWDLAGTPAEVEKATSVLGRKTKTLRFGLRSSFLDLLVHLALVLFWRIFTITKVYRYFCHGLAFVLVIWNMGQKKQQGQISKDISLVLRSNDWPRYVFGSISDCLCCVRHVVRKKQGSPGAWFEAAAAIGEFKLATYFHGFSLVGGWVMTIKWNLELYSIRIHLTHESLWPPLLRLTFVNLTLSSFLLYIGHAPRGLVRACLS